MKSMKFSDSIVQYSMMNIIIFKILFLYIDLYELIKEILIINGLWTEWSSLLSIRIIKVLFASRNWNKE